MPKLTIRTKKEVRPPTQRVGSGKGSGLDRVQAVAAHLRIDPHEAQKFVTRLDKVAKHTYRTETILASLRFRMTPEALAKRIEAQQRTAKAQNRPINVIYTGFEGNRSRH